MEMHGANSLEADDWIRASFEVLRDEGVGGVKITKIAKKLGVTSGSFYWHFGKMQDLLDALLDHWEVFQTKRIIENTRAFDGPADQRILWLMTRVIRDRAAEADPAVVAWTKHDPVILKRYEKAMDARLDCASWMFEQAGFSGAAAAQRGRLMVAYLIGESATGLQRKKNWRDLLLTQYQFLTSPE